MLRVIGEVCPKNVFAENVSEDAIIEAQADLARAGYQTVRGLVGAGDVGADHPRERWWLAANANHEGKLGGSVDAEMAKLKACGKGVWQAEPECTRIPYGTAGRLDRFTCIGNAQVPIVAALAWEILTEGGDDE